MLVEDNVVPIPVRGVEPRNPFLTVRDSSPGQKYAILEPAPRHRAAADRGTLGIRDRIWVAGHPYHPGGRSGEVVGALQLGWRSDPCISDFYFPTTLRW